MSSQQTVIFQHAALRHCFSKRRYTSIEVAESVVKRMEEQLGEAFHWYWCEQGCDGIHAGHARVSK